MTRNTSFIARYPLKLEYREEFQSLSHETDPQLYYEGLLNLGKRLEARDRLQEAAKVYSAILQAPAPGVDLRESIGVSEYRSIGEKPSASNSPTPRHSATPTLAQRAQERLDAIHGVGSSAARIEFNFHRFAREAASPSALFAMGAAGAAFRLTKLASLSRLATTPLGYLGRQALANTAAFFAETATFTLAGKTGAQLTGVKQDWSPNSVAKEWAGGATMFLGLKVLGGVTGQLTEKIGALGRAPLQQFGMLSGIMLGNKLSELSGLREHHDNATTLVDSLSTLLQFNISGHLLNGLMGERYQSWERGVEMQSEAIARQYSNTLMQHLQMRPRLATSGGDESSDLNWNMEGETDIENPRLQNIFPNPPPTRRKIKIIEKIHELKDSPKLNESAPPSPINHSRIYNILPLEHGGFIVERDLRVALNNLPDSVRCLELYTDFSPKSGKGTHSRQLLHFLRETFSRTLYDASNLGEIRIYLQDSSMMCFSKNHQGRMLFSHFDSSQARGLEGNKKYPLEAKQIFLMNLYQEDSQENFYFPSLLKTLRAKSQLSYEQVADNFRNYSGKELSPNTLRSYERGSESAIPLETLKGLAQVFQIDPHILISASNRSRYPKLRPLEWMTKHYPIYLEGRTDLLRLKFFREIDPQYRSLGWLIFSNRKNPDHPQSANELADAIGVYFTSMIYLETSLRTDKYPSLQIVEALSRSLKVSEAEILRRANRERYPDLPLAQISAESYFLEPSSEDLKKIRHYLNNPGTLGETLFHHRKSRPANLNAAQMGQQIGHCEQYWGDREWNRVPVDHKNWRDWLNLFLQQNIPLDSLLPELRKLGITPTNPAFLLAYALGEETQKHFYERTGIDVQTTSSILHTGSEPSSRTFTPETILSLQRALPNLQGDLFYRAYHPRIAEFFPEAGTDSPYLSLSQSEFEAAFRLDIREKLFAYRMDHHIHVVGVGQRLGVTGAAVHHFQEQVRNISSDEVLLRMAEMLEINPRLLYLHYRPHLLELFRISDPNTQTPFFLKEEERQRLLQIKEDSLDSSNMRNQLQQAMKLHGLEDVASLAEFMGLKDIKTAKKYLKTDITLSPQEILELTRHFPELSYRKWYEHFNRHALVYFLGKNLDGSVNYVFTASQFADLNSEKILEMVNEAMRKKYGTPQETGRQLKLDFVKTKKVLEDSIRRLIWSDDNIARISKGLDLDPRLLFLYFRQEDLRPILEGLPQDRANLSQR